MRKAFAKIHLWFSIPFGIIISVVCLSGAALVFEQDITRALNPGFYRVEVEDGAKPLTPSELVTKLRTQLPDSLRISGLQMSGDPEEAWMVSFEPLHRRDKRMEQKLSFLSDHAQTSSLADGCSASERRQDRG